MDSTTEAGAEEVGVFFAEANAPSSTTMPPPVPTAITIATIPPPPTLTTLPNELKEAIAKYLSPIQSICLGLTARDFHEIHKRIHTGLIKLTDGEFISVKSLGMRHEREFEVKLHTFLRYWMYNRTGLVWGGSVGHEFIAKQDLIDLTEGHAKIQAEYNKLVPMLARAVEKHAKFKSTNVWMYQQLRAYKRDNPEWESCPRYAHMQEVYSSRSEHSIVKQLEPQIITAQKLVRETEKVLREFELYTKQARFEAFYSKFIAKYGYTSKENARIRLARWVIRIGPASQTWGKVFESEDILANSLGFGGAEGFWN